MPYSSRLALFMLIGLLMKLPFALAAQTFSPFVEEEIKILENRLVYKGKSVAIPLTRKELIATFGKPSREIYNTAGTMVIWDDVGLTCYGCQDKSGTPEEFQYMSKDEQAQIKPDDKIESITFYLRKYNPYPDLERKKIHEPRSPFYGQILLDGVSLDGRVTFEYFLEKRKSDFTMILPENTFSFFIRCQPTPHEITLHSIRNPYDDDYLSIFAVSVRNVAQYYKKLPCIDVFKLDETPEAVEKIKQEKLDEESPNNFEAMEAEKRAREKQQEKPAPAQPPARETPVIDAPKPVSDPG